MNEPILESELVPDDLESKATEDLLLPGTGLLWVGV